MSVNFQLVQQVGKSLHLFRNEIARWRKILEEPYSEYQLSRKELGVTIMLPAADFRILFVFKTYITYVNDRGVHLKC